MKTALLKFFDAVKHRGDYLRRHRRWEVLLATGLSLALGFTYLFVELADEITAGETQLLDERILVSLRRLDDPEVPIGPAWLRGTMLDLTALGGPAVLGMITIAIVGFFFLEGQRRVALLTIATVGGGGLASVALKWIFARPRPDVVPHLREVSSASFPSGHAMSSAVVYLTVGVMFMKTVRGGWAKSYVLAWGILLTLLVGLSRIYLGVHYPSDVLGGWLAGLCWASGCWVIGQFIPSRPMPTADDRTREETRPG